MGGKRKRRVTNVTNLTKQNISACNKMVFDFIKTHELQGLRVCVERSFNLAPFFSLLFFSPLSGNSYSFLSARVKKKKKKLPFLEHCKNTDILHCCTSSSQCNLQKHHILTKDKQKAHCRKMNRKKNRLRRCATHGKEHISAVKEEKKSFSPVSSKLRKIAIRSLLLLE